MSIILPRVRHAGFGGPITAAAEKPVDDRIRRGMAESKHALPERVDDNRYFSAAENAELAGFLEKAHAPFREARQLRWSPPTEGVIKINVDAVVLSAENRIGLGAIKINVDAVVLSAENRIGLGAVARDMNGNCVAWKVKNFTASVNAECAEAMAIQLAIELYRERGWPAVVIEGDNLSVISALNKNEVDLSMVGVILEDIRRVMLVY